MRKLGVILLTGALLAATPTMVWAREYKEDSHKINISDTLASQYDTQIVAGVKNYDAVHPVDWTLGVDVTRVVAFADGAVEVKLNWHDGGDTVVISKDGSILMDRFMVDTSPEVDNIYTPFIVEGLTQWAIANAPMGGVVLQSVSEDATTCEVLVNNEVRELSISREEELSATTVHVVNWFSFEQEPTTELEFNTLGRMAKHMYNEGMVLGTVHISSIQQEGEMTTLFAKTTGLDIYYTCAKYGDNWVAIENETAKSNVPMIGRD